MKTTEQRATAYAAGLSKTPGYDPAIRLAYLQGAEDALEGQWVSVKDGLPEDGVDVFVAYRGRLTGYIHYSVAWTDNEGRWYSADDEVNFLGIVVWMPIPQYQGKEADNG